MRGLSAFKSLSAIKENLPAVIFRTHGEVNPIGSAALLLDQFIKHPAVFIGGVEQETGIPYHLLWAQTFNIYGATCQIDLEISTFMFIFANEIRQ